METLYDKLKPELKQGIENNMEKGLFVSDFTDFPMPQLMRNFREKYKTKLSIF